MKTTLSEREGNTVKLAVEVSGDELQEAFDSRLKQVAKEARIPGFRPSALRTAAGRTICPLVDTSTAPIACPRSFTR